MTDHPSAVDGRFAFYYPLKLMERREMSQKGFATRARVNLSLSPQPIHPVRGSFLGEAEWVGLD